MFTSGSASHVTCGMYVDIMFVQPHNLSLGNAIPINQYSVQHYVIGSKLCFFEMDDPKPAHIAPYMHIII